MENEYSPYRYVNLTPQKWDDRSDELLREELQKKDTDADPAQAVGARLFKEIVIELFKYPPIRSNPSRVNSSRAVWR